MDKKQPDILSMDKKQPDILPIDQRSLICTCSQIFQKAKKFRNILLRYMQDNISVVETETKYIDSQIQIIETFVSDNSAKTYHRFITHQKKVIQISVEIHWIKDPMSIGSPYQMMWSISGPDLQEIFRFLPNAITFDGTISKIKKPFRGSSDSRWYQMRGNYQIFKRISLELRMLQLYICASKQHIVPRCAISDTGILNLDVKVCTDILADCDSLIGSKFIELINTFDKNRGNPQKIAPGIYLYNKNGTSIHILNNIFKSDILRIPGLFPQYIDLSDKTLEKAKDQLQQMMEYNSTYKFGLMNLNKHMMCWLRNGNKWILIDPWKKSFNPKPDIIVLFDTMIWEFIPRTYSEQYKSEGSCVIASLSRIIQMGIKSMLHKHMMSDFNLMINEPITDWAAILASCLVRSCI